MTVMKGVSLPYRDCLPATTSISLSSKFQETKTFSTNELATPISREMRTIKR